MLRLRPFKPCDAKTVVAWVRNEETLMKWSAGKFGEFPICADDINKMYFENNGDCADEDNFYPVTAFDESGVAGQMILRFTDDKKEVLRFGLVIVDNAKRGKGYGKQMLKLALKYAFEILGAKKVTIGVFENNPSALHCYKSVGFKKVGEEYWNVLGEQWKCIELELKNK